MNQIVDDSSGGVRHFDGVARRSIYVPLWPQETFMVPLLDHYIRALLDDAQAALLPNRRVLDLGCGEQPLKSTLIERGYEYFSSDVQQNASESVDFLGPVDGPLHADLLAAPTFGLIVCTEVCEHVADWTIAFENMARLLSPGGLLLLTCPFFYFLHEQPYDFWRPTPHAVRFHAARAGLTVVRQEQAGDVWDVLGTLLASLDPWPQSRRLTHRTASRFVRIACKGCVSLLRGPFPRRFVRGTNLFYMNNVALLQKPAVD